jgi:maltose phosphorylase
MIDYLADDDWRIVEETFDPSHQLMSESIFSIGNGKMGQRANFEEKYSGPSFQGSYVGGIYYPDKTRVGWWKNGYPEYYAKVINSVNWIGIHWLIDGEPLDLAQCRIDAFKRILDMQTGLLKRQFVATLPSGCKVQVQVQRFISLAEDDFGMIKYEITPLNKTVKIKVSSFLDFDVFNQDSNYDEYFWKKTKVFERDDIAFCTGRTKKTKFDVVASMRNHVFAGETEILDFETEYGKRKIFNAFEFKLHHGETARFEKTVCIVNSLINQGRDLVEHAKEQILEFDKTGFDGHFENHKNAWAEIWKNSDIVIHGDNKAQQAIRYNIFQLYQTYSGKYSQLNIGPKGFTGEKYGGATYWDTEAYCLPFYLGTADKKIARQLLLYRYNQLDKAIENAGKLGFGNGAALFPMVTMNGEECHNEWEITFEEIHRNGAIVYAIDRYVNYTGDWDYVREYGLEVCIAVSRFWEQRVNWSQEKDHYVILGVTGPNEYENNVNNNWYTNYLARWTLMTTLQYLEKIKQESPDEYNRIINVTGFEEKAEVEKWQEIIDKMYFPWDDDLEIYLQQDGFMDKEQWLVKDLPADQRPLNQYWSWDRILRSNFIKQADVLQGFYFFENDFSTESLKRHFDFYEKRTVHESSLSPCVHAILAAKLGDMNKAYQYYINTSRLDLDDYNNEVKEGLHITSMAGTWMSVVEGFGGFRVKNGHVSIYPQIPDQWEGFEFNIHFRDNRIKISCSKSNVEVKNMEGPAMAIYVYGGLYDLGTGGSLKVEK